MQWWGFFAHHRMQLITLVRYTKRRKHRMKRKRATARLARPALVAGAVLAVATIASGAQPASAQVNQTYCKGFAVDFGIPAAGFLRNYIQAENLPGPDMFGSGETFNGQSACVPHSGWTAEVTIAGYTLSGPGATWVGCPGAIAYQSSSSGGAYAATGCDGSQYYAISTWHRVWFSGTYHDSGAVPLEASW
jgi:hypothetical protein